MREFENLLLRKTKNFFIFQKFNISQNIANINFQNNWILKEIIPGVSTIVRRSLTPRSSISIVFFSIVVVFSMRSRKNWFWQ